MHCLVVDDRQRIQAIAAGLAQDGVAERMTAELPDDLATRSSGVPVGA